MKSITKCLLVLLLLPATMLGQVFKTPDLSFQADVALLAKEIEKHSPLMKKFYSSVQVPMDISPEKARELVYEKLKELSNEKLNKTYQDVSPENVARIGIILYLMMNGWSNTEDYPGLDYKLAFGGGLGVFLMYTLANFVLMPELAFWYRPLLQDYDGDKYRERYSYLTLAFTAMYIIRLQTINLLVGLSPNFGYALSGGYKEDDEDWEDIEFDDYGVKRSNFGLGITAGIMLQNSMMIRLMYNLGLSKMYENQDTRMYAIMLAVSIPLWTLNK